MGLRCDAVEFTKHQPPVAVNGKEGVFIADLAPEDGEVFTE